MENWLYIMADVGLFLINKFIYKISFYLKLILSWPALKGFAVKNAMMYINHSS